MIKLKHAGNSTWANDNQTIFYTTQDANTLRSDTVLKHKMELINQRSGLF
jgi:protease II